MLAVANRILFCKDHLSWQLKFSSNFKWLRKAVFIRLFPLYNNCNQLIMQPRSIVRDRHASESAWFYTTWSYNSKQRRLFNHSMDQLHPQIVHTWKALKERDILNAKKTIRTKSTDFTFATYFPLSSFRSMQPLLLSNDT